MAKVGTAHLEIKPVLNEEALDIIAAKIQEAVEKGVRDGMAAALPQRDAPLVHVQNMTVRDVDDLVRKSASRPRPSLG